MAITATVLDSGATAQGDGTFTTGTVSPGDGLVLLFATAGPQTADTALDPTSVSGLHATWTKVAGAPSWNVVGHVYVASGATGSGAVTVTYPQAINNATWCVVEFGGASGIAQHAIDRASTVTLPNPPADTSATVGMAFVNYNKITSGDGFTELFNQNTTAPANVMAVEWTTTPTQTATASSGTALLEIVALELAATGSATSSTVKVNTADGWVEGTPKVWDGTTWVEGVAKTWNGSTWQ